jgi:hypothetical protein
MINRPRTFIALLVISIFAGTLPHSSSWALNSCQIERPSEVASFERGSSTPSLPPSSDSSDPSILLRATSDVESLRLGIGGAITLKFTVPLANYPAAGSLTLERPAGAPPCSSYPVRAEISGSLDGQHFIPLGSTCETSTFELGSFPWIAYLRIRDVTNVSDPAFGSAPISGFDLRSVSGPACLKYAHCAVSAPPDSSVTDSQSSSALSLSNIGDDFVFEQPASFEEYGNGTARLSGTVYSLSNPSIAYEMIMSLTGRVQSPPLNSPVLALKSSAYSSQGGTVDPSSWYYYKQLNGTLFGRKTLSGETILIANTARAMQIGDGANGRNTSFGARGSFAYDSAPSGSTGGIAINLTSCSSLPSPTPPAALPESKPTPKDGVKIESPSCQTNDLSNKLAFLDHNLSKRGAIINRATLLLVGEDRSQSSARFRTNIRSKARNLYVQAWGDVWVHDRIVQTCLPSTLCFDLHLEPKQAALAASARNLDSTVERALLYVKKRLSSRKNKRALKELTKKHMRLRGAFMSALSELPRHSTSCQR